MRFQASSTVLLALLASTGCKRRAQTESPTPSATAPAALAPGAAATPQAVRTTESAAGASSTRSTPPTAATGCPATQPNRALGPGTVHSSEITQSETWSLEGSPHRLPDGASIRTGATVTIAPCAVVLVGSRNRFLVDEGGALVAVGDAEHPIRIGSDNPDPQPGDWTGLAFHEQARSTSRLGFVTIEHGGASYRTHSACLEIGLLGLEVQHVTAQHCRAFGVALTETGAFAPTSTALRVTGTVTRDAEQSAAVVFDHPNAVRTLPAGTYTGNEVDEILVTGGNSGRPVRTSGTWQNPGVRYRIEDHSGLWIEGPTGPVLTLAPGTTVAFGRDAELRVGLNAEGGIVADGQSEEGRITFTSASSDPSPGSWSGIVLGERFNRARSRFQFATIGYGGMHASLCSWSEDQAQQAMVRIDAPPHAELFRHVRFTGAPENGAVIGRTWNGAAVNFATATLGNDFAQAGTSCRQSPVRDASGGCGDTRPCE
jgi:hypothetical protein